MRVAAIACATAAVVLFSGAATAQEVCVACKGPDRGYRCTVKDGDRVKHVRGAQKGIEFLCLSELARAGGHESCRVSTGYSGPCIGHPYEIDVAQVVRDNVVLGRPPEVDAGAAGAAVAVPAKPQATPAKKGPPETLEQLARETLEKSKNQLSNADESVRKAGGAVTGAMKQTWECIASFFKRC
jgi:hypothetical protein